MHRLVLVLIAAFLCTEPVFAGMNDPLPHRQRELLYLLEQDCGSCHGMTMKGGLGPSLLPEDLAEKPDEGLVDAILEGRPGTPMPPWAFEISEDEAFWLIQKLRRGEIAE